MRNVNSYGNHQGLHEKDFPRALNGRLCFLNFASVALQNSFSPILIIFILNGRLEHFFIFHTSPFKEESLRLYIHYVAKMSQRSMKMKKKTPNNYLFD